MKEVTTTVYCDRCGKKIDTYDYRTAIEVYAAAENCMEGIPKDLCKDCAVSFKQWLYEGKQQQDNDDEKGCLLCKYHDNEEGCSYYIMGIGDPEHMPCYVKK